jgi:tRNA(Ile2) C34 agmatinyltransferase TiaS
MNNRTPNCIYCNQKMESQSSKKKFCSDKCRVYWHRKYPKGNTISPIELASKLEDINKKVSVPPNKQAVENEPKEGTLAWFLKKS